jgi:hypothetical protein
MSTPAYPIASTWLYDTLTDTPITGVTGVYEDAAPQGATDKNSRWVEFELFAPGQDVAEVAEQRIWTELTFMVRVVMRGRSSVALTDIAAEVDDRLHRASGTTADGAVISSTRSQEHQENWTEMGIEYRALGGVYHLIVQPA